MSDTPRTDALLETILDRAGQVGPRNCPEEWVTLCRKLELELKDAWQIASKYDDRYFATRELLTVSTERAERLERELAETATEIQTLRTANAGLVKEVRQLSDLRERAEERVMRLEEAGGKMAELLDCYAGFNETEEWACSTRSQHIKDTRIATEMWAKAKGQP